MIHYLRDPKKSALADDYWKPYMAGSVVLIGQAGSALFRLLEILDENKNLRPAVVNGTRGGAVLAAEALNALMNVPQGIYV